MSRSGCTITNRLTETSTRLLVLPPLGILLLLVIIIGPAAVPAAAQYMFNVIDESATATEVYAANDAGDIVGFYRDSNRVSHGFLLSRGNVTNIDYPGASATQAYSINNAGTIVGI